MESTSVLFVFINRKLVNLCVNVTDQTSNPPQSLKTVAEARLQTAGSIQQFVHCVCNVMAHAQKPDFVFRHNGLVHLNRRGASGQSTTGSRGVRISGSNAGYTMFRGSVKCTVYPLHSPVSPSLPLPCVTVCHHISTGLYPQMGHQKAQDCHLVVSTCTVPTSVSIVSVSHPWRHGKTRWQFKRILLRLVVQTLFYFQLIIHKLSPFRPGKHIFYLESLEISLL